MSTFVLFRKRITAYEPTYTSNRLLQVRTNKILSQSVRQYQSLQTHGLIDGKVLKAALGVMVDRRNKLRPKWTRLFKDKSCVATVRDGQVTVEPRRSHHDA